MSPPKLMMAAPTFLVPDVATTAAWYEQQLGFTASFFPKQPTYVYASLHRDHVEIMLLRLESYRKPVVERPTGHWDAYIRMQGVREFYDSVRQKIPIKMELTKQSMATSNLRFSIPTGTSWFSANEPGAESSF